MRAIERSNAFKRDYKRELKGRHRMTLNEVVTKILTSLAMNEPLKPRHRDHDLSGNWAGYRECHIKPDLLLIYRKLNKDLLRLARLGSHAELFS